MKFCHDKLESLRQPTMHFVILACTVLMQIQSVRNGQTSVCLSVIWLTVQVIMCRRLKCHVIKSWVIKYQSPNCHWRRWEAIR